METVPESEIAGRVASFKARLAARGLAGALITSRPDRYYLSGTIQDGLLWVDAVGDPILWVLRDVERADAESPLPAIPVASRRDLWSQARSMASARRIGLVSDTLILADFARLGLALEAVEDVSPELLAQRSRKSPWEVAKMEAAARVADAVYAHAGEVLRPGMTEAEVGGLLFARAMALGHEGLLRGRGGFEPYSWHILSGPNAALPGVNDSPQSGEGLSPSFPMGAGRREIRRGEPVLIDFGTCVFGYQTDQTRTFCLGPAPDGLRDAHRALEEVYDEAIRALAPGASAGSVFAAASARAEALRLDGYLGSPGKRCRFVGHGVGLETAEPPILADGSAQRLETGMTVAVEPKAVLDGSGGVGMEDTFLVTDEGSRPFTMMPRKLIVI